jgi:eukaryotic-like serine/threonine-protein kinase
VREADTFASVRVGRYQVFREIARGGMGSVHLGRLTSEFNVGRVVAVKRLHAHIGADPQFVRMFLDEARLCARIRHRNVVSLLDLVSKDDELCMVLEYVEGETLGKLLESARRRCLRVPDEIVSGVVAGALHGLHAAHEAKSEDGSPLGVVHRDFSPQNVLVGVDGAARVADFGVAKAAIRLQTTRDGQIKGKLGYMSPEQISGHDVDRRTDVFAAGAVLWEMLAQKRLFTGESEGQILMKIVRGEVDPVTDHAPGVDPAWDRIVERALALSPESRFATAREMALAIEASFPSAPASRIGEWVNALADDSLRKRAEWVAEVERAPSGPEADDAPPRSFAAVTRAAPPAEPGSARTPRETTVATPEALSRSKRTKPVSPRFGFVIIAVAAAGVGAFALSRGTVTRSEAASSAAPEPSGARQERSSAPAQPATSVAAETPVVEPSSTAPAAPSSAGPAQPAPRRGRAAPPKKAPAAAPASSAGCRYFDDKEKIWKFRRGCYK